MPSRAENRIEKELSQPVTIQEDRTRLSQLTKEDITCSSAEFALAILAILDWQNWRHFDKNGEELRWSKIGFEDFMRKQHYDDAGIKSLYHTAANDSKKIKQREKNAGRFKAIWRSDTRSIRRIMRYHEVICELLWVKEIEPSNIGSLLQRLSYEDISWEVQKKVTDALSIVRILGERIKKV